MVPEQNDLSKLSKRELYAAAAAAEGYESVPVDIDTFLDDPYYLGQTYGDGAVYPYWREALHKIYPNPLYSPYVEVCLSGDTEVDLLDGSTKTMKEICDEGPDHVFWVLAFNRNTKEYEPCKAGAAKMTGIKPVYKVTLDNGKWFKATGNHKILGKDNRWYRTDALKVGQSLMPYNLTYDENGYAYVWDNSAHKNVKRARLVQHWKNGIPPKYHTHHKDQNRTNDVPENIIALAPAQHMAIHNVLLHKAMKDPEAARVIKEKMSASQHAYKNAYPEQFAEKCRKGGKAAWAANLDKLLKRLNQMPGLADTNPKKLPYPLQKVISRHFGCFRAGTENIDNDMLLAQWPYIVEQAQNYNHRIVSIELLPPEPVYNFTVDRLHNYTLNCGAVVSNCITGCIGAGKTSFAIMGALYDLYHVTLLKEPQRKYKLLRTTRIIFSLVTATKDLASAVMANQMLDVIAASPYFCSKFMPKKGEKLDDDMFPHHVGVGFGSRGGHNLGKAVIGAIIDEANFQDKVADQAIKNYETITRRMKSRFMLKNGSLPCRRWLVSSRNGDAAFLESHIEAVKGNPGVIVFAPAMWDIHKVKGIYSGKTFPVFIGTNTEQPMICATEKEVADHAGYVIDVPVEYREDFETNLPGALMDIAGVSSRSGMSLIYNVEKWIKCQCLDNAMSKDEITLSIDGEDHLIDYLKKDLPKLSYYGHLDGALNGDRFGFAMSAIDKQMAVSGYDFLTGKKTLRLMPSLVTPLCFGIKARPGSEVPLWKVRKFLLDLRNMGVRIMQVSTDGFQSADMRQMLAKMGFEVKYVSVDTTKEPYLQFASGVNHGTVKVPRSTILDFEVRNLQNQEKKIDHPDKVMVDGHYVKGSKDIADAIAASQHEALMAAQTLTESSITEQFEENTHMSMKDRQEYVQDLIFGQIVGGAGPKNMY